MKKFTNDIYITINKKLFTNNFWSIDIEKKKELINKELINYTLLKINELGLGKYINDKQSEVSLESLFKSIDINLKTLEEKNEFFRHYTHYILDVAGTLQRWEILWWEEDKKELINSPLIKFDDYGRWDKVYSHSQTPPLQITLFVLDVFNNQFGKIKEKVEYPKKSLTYS